MTTSTDVAVTYTGTEDPFKDRIYRSGLTFTPGQTRVVPATLAARFLRHEDVFKEGEVAAPVKKQELGSIKQELDAKNEEQDDTKTVLEQQDKQRDDQRQQEDARFALIDSIESMDRKAVIDWAEQHYKQKIPGNVSVANAREMAKSFIDQYGMPA